MGNVKNDPELMLFRDLIGEIKLCSPESSFDLPMIRAGPEMDGPGNKMFDTEELERRKTRCTGRSAYTISPDGRVCSCRIFMGFPGRFFCFPIIHRRAQRDLCRPF